MIPRFLLVLSLLPLAAWAQPHSVHIEDLTWPEVRDAIAGGRTSALYYAGSTEQNGPHMALGKHNVVARHVAGRIAQQLGNALVYPVLPFAPTGGHMKFPGSVSLSERTFAAVAREVAASAIAAGFRRVFVMGDHGGGQDELKAVARELDARWRARGVRVHYVPDVYYKSVGKHAGVEDTSALMALDGEQRWIRRDRLAPGSAASGVEGDPRQASPELGRAFLDTKVASAVAQIKDLMAKE